MRHFAAAAYPEDSSAAKRRRDCLQENKWLREIPANRSPVDLALALRADFVLPFESQRQTRLWPRPISPNEPGRARPENPISAIGRRDLAPVSRLLPNDLHQTRSVPREDELDQRRYPGRARAVPAQTP